MMMLIFELYIRIWTCYGARMSRVIMCAQRLTSITTYFGGAWGYAH
jgi:hypothetical protein